MIHIYTGDGKGKTTAALGLALRAAGAEKKVAIIQFLKKPNTSEYRAIKKFKLPILIKAFGIGFYFGALKRRKNLKKIYKILGDDKPAAKHRAVAKKALKKAREIIEKGGADVIILDEINVAINYGLVDIKEVIEIIQFQRKAVGGKRSAEIILTGRNAHPKLKKLADLVTVMKKHKHYFDADVRARRGIEY